MTTQAARTAALPGWRWPWSADHDTRMPARVERTIADLRRRNEILIGWVQAALVLVLGTLYLAAPSTSPADAVFRPVPWALGTYGAFTALRLRLAYRGRLTTLFSLLSIVVDIAMLMITIWSFHIQYGQPAAFYLKAPTLLYVFIFIVLRALTLSPGHVVLTGLTAAAGWLCLLLYALLAPGGESLLTRDYVEYMTSAKILIGGEIDRILSILIVTAVLAVSVARARTLLWRAVTDQAAASQLARFFSPEVAERLARADELLQPGDGDQRQAAAMFIDLRGFTTLAATLPPARLMQMLRDYQGVTVPIVHRHGGSVVTFLGDGILVTFGATLASETYCADALRCADELLDALSTWCKACEDMGVPAPGVGIGVDAGTVTCGVIGEEGRLEYAVIGNPVNRAAKLQNHTKHEGVPALASASCVERARAQGYASAQSPRLLPDRKVEGLPGNIDLAVLREPPAAAPPAAD